MPLTGIVCPKVWLLETILIEKRRAGKQLRKNCSKEKIIELWFLLCPTSNLYGLLNIEIEPHRSQGGFYLSVLAKFEYHKDIIEGVKRVKSIPEHCQK